MKKYLNINYKSDFACLIQFAIGGVVHSPDFDFDLRFSTGAGEYSVSQKNGVLTNATKNADNKLLGMFINHNMGQGVMLCEQVLFYPNASYPTGIQKIHGVYQTGAMLINGIGDELLSCTIDGVLPTADYNMLLNKPLVNGVELKGDKSNDDLKLTMSFLSIS